MGDAPFPSAQGRLNHEPDSTLAVTKTCPKDGVHLSASPEPTCLSDPCLRPWLTPPTPGRTRLLPVFIDVISRSRQKLPPK